jgi:hypothetical protein
MSITPPTGILDITDAIVRVSKLEFRGATGFDTILNNVARNTALLVDQNVEYTTDNAWGLKLPNAWVSEFDAYWASGASGNIDFNIYNNTTSGTNGYVISMDDTTITVTYDGGSALETVSLGSTLKNDTWRKIHILFERDMISLAIDGTPVLYFKDTLLRPRVYDEDSGYVIASGLSADRKVKNLRILNGDKWMTDNTSNIAFVHGNVGIGTTQAAYTLDVKGDIRATGNLLIEGLTTTVDTQNLSIEDAIVEIGRGNDGGTSGKDVGFLFTRNNGADTTNSNVALIYDESTDRLTFGYSDGSPTDSTLAINTSKSLSVVIPSGNLGIGTDSPATPFNINKLTATVNPKAHTTTEFIRLRGDKVIGQTYAISGGIKLGGDTGGTATADGRIEFYANDGADVGNSYGDVPDNFIMCMRGDGNVGIGTTNPGTALEIYGEGKDFTFKYDTGLTRQSAANRDSYYSAKENSIKRVGDRNLLDNSPFTPDTTHEILFGFSDTYTQWQTNDEYYPSYNEMRFKLWTPTNSTTGSLKDIMTLRSNGNVGIGTTSPGYKLDVNGLASSKTSRVFEFSGSDNYARHFWICSFLDAPGYHTNQLIKINYSVTYKRLTGTHSRNSIASGTVTLSDLWRYSTNGNSGEFQYVTLQDQKNEQYSGQGRVPKWYYVRFNNIGYLVLSMSISDGNTSSYYVKGNVDFLTRPTAESADRIFNGTVYKDSSLAQTEGFTSISDLYPTTGTGVDGWDTTMTSESTAQNFIEATEGTVFKYGNVGIGVTNPYGNLHVYTGGGGPSSADCLVIGDPNGSAAVNVRMGAASDYAWIQSHEGSPLRINPGGNTITYGNANTTLSDDRIKDNEEYIRDATQTLVKLKPQIYDKHLIWDLSSEDASNVTTVRESGLITQDVWYDAPELRYLVHLGREAHPSETKPYTDDDPQNDPDYSTWGNEPSTLNYTGLIPYLIKSNQELYTDLQAEKVKVATLETQLASVLARLDALESA